METTNIYVLIDPRTKEIRYVGKANNVSQRYKAHLNRARKHQIHKKNWIDLLKKEKLKPIIEIIDIVPINEWQFWETYWISQFKCWGFNLINYTIGGDGCTFGNQTTFKKGHGGKKVVCLNKKGDYIKTFNSVLEAEKSILKRGIDSVLSKKTKTCGGFIWLYEKEFLNLQKEDLKKIVYNTNRKKIGNNSTLFKKGNVSWNKNNKGYKLSGEKQAKKVLQFDLDGNFIKEYDSVKDAAKELNCDQETIRTVCVNKNKTGKGFKWKYKI
jgi:hypothetical protein